MNLLVDSRLLLWWLTDSDQLPAEARQAIDVAGEVYASAASAWQLGIRYQSGELPLPPDLESLIRAAGLRLLPVTFRHSLVAASLPKHHRDPFDRMLVAQALCESLILLTSNPSLSKYGLFVRVV